MQGRGSSSDWLVRGTACALQDVGDKFVERVAGGARDTAGAAAHAQQSTTGFTPHTDTLEAAMRGTAAPTSTVPPGTRRDGLTDVPDPTHSTGSGAWGEEPTLGGARGPAGKGPQATIQESVRDFGRKP